MSTPHAIAPSTTTGKVYVTDQDRKTYRVSVANAINSSSRLNAEFDTPEEAFGYARNNRCYFNNTRITLWKIVGWVTREEIRYPPRRPHAPGERVQVARPLIADIEINDLTTLADLVNLGAPAPGPSPAAG
jgi:hypothetical protein